MAREHERKPVTMSGKLKTSYGRQDVAVSDLSQTGCRIGAIYLTLAVGQKIIFRPEGLEMLNATVSWVTGPTAGIAFDNPLHLSVLDYLVKLHPDETRPITVEIVEKTDDA
jgi:hypothetical protein